MNLLICVFAAIISTIVFYNNQNRSKLKLSFLALMFWGASAMWLCDAVAEYLEVGAEYFNPAPADMINDAFLGLSVVAFGLIIWLVAVLISDPKGVFKKVK